MANFSNLREISNPSNGWVSAVRLALGMSMEQLGKKLSISKQSVLDLEKREKLGNITINSLRNAANALDMQLVYGFLPKDGSLDALIERKAKEMALKIVMRTHQTMKLESQEISDESYEKALAEKIIQIKIEIPKSLWD